MGRLPPWPPEGTKLLFFTMRACMLETRQEQMTMATTKRHDYMPFGEELLRRKDLRTTTQGYTGDTIRQKFTSKERDIETGLDYFDARYYSSTQGRFTSPDLLSGRPGLPQSWNRYTYSFNNPLLYVDMDGKWPTRIHEMIIDRTFQGLSKASREFIKSGSWGVDNPNTGGQNTERSNEHGMTIPGQSQDEAARNANQFINKNVSDAQRFYECGGPQEAPGLNHWALSNFGAAWHTVSDMTSPMHEGYQVWHGGVGSTMDHIGGESSINAFRMGLVTGATLKLFAYTFGQKELSRATGGIQFGSENDPNIQDIRSQFTLAGTHPSFEAEAVYEYRIGLQRGLKFDWANQHGGRSR